MTVRQSNMFSVGSAPRDVGHGFIRHGKRTAAPWLLVIAGIALAFLAGLAATTGQLLVVGVLAAIILGATLLTNPKLHIVGAMAFAMVATGVLEFFFFFGQANWLSSLLVGGGIIAAVLHSASPSRRDEPDTKLTVFGGLLAAYLILLAASSAINQISVAQAIVGVRNYVPYIGVSALILYCRFQPSFVNKLPFGLLGIGLVQMPFALFQHFVTGPWRAALRNAVGRSDEAIVGSFGGSAITGGYTGEMAAFLVMCIIFVIALRRERIIGMLLAGTMSIVLLIPILLAETKVSLVLLPVLILVCFFRDAIRNPKFFFFLIGGSILLVGSISTVYFVRYWQDAAGALVALGYSFDPDFMISQYQRGRVGTLLHWYETIPGSGQIVTAMIGHGVASSLENSSTIGAGSAVIRYGLGLDLHAMSRLLWDLGIVGFGVFLVISVRTFWVGRKLSIRAELMPQVRASLVFCSGAGLGMTLMLPYQTSVLGGAAMQFLFWFCVGYVEYQRRLLQRSLNVAPLKR